MVRPESSSRRGASAGDRHMVALNKRARFRYEVLQEVEVGLVLTGAEVKSLREGKLSLDEAFGRIDGDEVFLLAAHIAPYGNSSVWQPEPTRKRKLLLHRREINRLRTKVTQKGLTLVPLALYFNARGLAKLTLALCRGKNVADKRETQKKRDAVREIRDA